MLNLDNRLYFIKTLLKKKSASDPAAKLGILARKEGCYEDILQLISDTVGAEICSVIEKSDATDLADVFRTVVIDPEMLGPLLENKEYLTATDDEGQTPLHVAVLWCDDVTVSSLVNALGAHITAEDMSGLMPVHYAAIAGNLENLKHLSSQLNVSGRRAGRYPLHYAAMAGRREVVAYILEHGGVNIDAQDCQGYTAMVLAAVCDQPQIVKLLIQKGASASVRDNSGTSALSEVALHYETLADLLLDRYVVRDYFDNSTTIDLSCILGSEGTCSNSKIQETSYRMLVRANKPALGHPAVTTLTDAKWKLFARKLYSLKMITMFLFNIFWTVKYLHPEESASSDYWWAPYGFVGVAYFITISHVAGTLIISRKEFLFTSKLLRSVKKADKMEMAINHQLTARYTAKAKLKITKYNALISTTRKTLVFGVFGALIVDAGFLYFTSTKFYAFLHHGNENYSSDFVTVSELGFALVLLLSWLRLFAMGNVAPSFGRFVIFTQKTIIDVSSIMGVYVLLFIPAVAIFYHTIYRHDDSSTVHWYDVPFIVMRMAVVDYDFELGYDIAQKQGLELWWNTLSLIWIVISAIIIMNLFIALMADRYSTLGETSQITCSQKRARFIADCELALGLKRAMKYEEQLVQSGVKIVVRNEGSVFKDNGGEQLQEKMQRDLELISAKLDKLIAAQPATAPSTAQESTI